MKPSQITSALVLLAGFSALAQPAEVKSNQSSALASDSTPRSGNPIFEGWYADPEAAIFDNQY